MKTIIILLIIFPFYTFCQSEYYPFRKLEKCIFLSDKDTLIYEYGGSIQKSTCKIYKTNDVDTVNIELFIKDNTIVYLVNGIILKLMECTPETGKILINDNQGLRSEIVGRIESLKVAGTLYNDVVILKTWFAQNSFVEYYYFARGVGIIKIIDFETNEYSLIQCLKSN